MANGFEVNISEREFKAKSADDQSWILFQGVTSLHEEGCAWGKKRYSKDRLKVWSAFGGGFAAVLGVIYLIYQITCR